MGFELYSQQSKKGLFGQAQQAPVGAVDMGAACRMTTIWGLVGDKESSWVRSDEAGNFRIGWR